ncbi:dynamin family protein [Aeromicrobium sp. CF4.19]|uniref:dynamin family protein n=1 Tax=Aeromicrobium sp. CF4.19 TaxID=3373082 RepID=UPI003EE67C58
MPHSTAVALDLDRITNRIHTLAVQSGRAELATRLDGAAALLADTSVRVVVVGQFKQGKSALVNALVSTPVCPVDDVLATSVPTVIRWGERPRAELVTEVGPDHAPVRTEIDPRTLRQHVTELAAEAGRLGALRAEVSLPREVLADGLTLVDTPGVGSAQGQASTTLTLLPQADAAIMLTDATQELTDPELGFLRQAISLCPRVTCVISKIDLQHQWRDIAEADHEHLRAADIDIPVLATSALLHDLADREDDSALARESRIGALETHLRETVRVDVLAERHKAVVEDICSVGEHLAMVLQAELSTVGDPAGGHRVVHDLEQAKEAADALTRRSARWQQTLSDGALELVSDVEFDLRDRLRAVGREAEQLIDECDPGEVWDDFGRWLSDSVAQAVSDNFVWTHQRSEHLATVVSQHFSVDGQAAVPDLSLSGGTDGILRSISGLELVQSGRLSFGQKIFIGMKGSYGGILMFGLMTSLAGMALVNPLSVAAGLLMGGFAYRQDSAQRLERRRSEAKTSVRRLVDEAIFQVGKESRDRMNRIKRVLRDHFTSVAEDLKRSLQESVRVAKDGVGLPQDERARRAIVLSRELDEINGLCDEALALTEVAPVAPPELRSA